MPTLAKAALDRLGVEVAPSALEKDYNARKQRRLLQVA
jgi:hypothetical protein